MPGVVSHAPVVPLDPDEPLVPEVPLLPVLAVLPVLPLVPAGHIQAVSGVLHVPPTEVQSELEHAPPLAVSGWQSPPVQVSGEKVESQSLGCVHTPQIRTDPLVLVVLDPVLPVVLVLDAEVELDPLVLVLATLLAPVEVLAPAVVLPEDPALLVDAVLLAWLVVDPAPVPAVVTVAVAPLELELEPVVLLEHPAASAHAAPIMLALKKLISIPFLCAGPSWIATQPSSVSPRREARRRSFSDHR